MRSSWVKLGRRYDPDQYWAGQHLKVTLTHNAEQATEEQGRRGEEEKKKKNRSKDTIMENKDHPDTRPKKITDQWHFLML